MERVIENEIVIERPPQDVYAYVTQPWRWHEWHPSSEGARADAEVMTVGQTFDEVICLQPLSPLPLTLRRHTRYQVDIAEPGRRWQVTGQTRGGGLGIGYTFHDIDGNTLFQRRLHYHVSGLMRVFEPLLYPRMQTLSWQALKNLKARLETG